MATAHTSNFGSFANRLAPLADRDGYVRFSKRDVEMVKRWLAADTDTADDDDEASERAIARRFPKVSTASARVALAEVGIESWQSRR